MPAQPTASAKPARRVTMTDVATHAGVSQSTVSLVLNGASGMRLSDPTRERVIRAAANLGYRLPGGRAPNLPAEAPGTTGAPTRPAPAAPATRSAAGRTRRADAAARHGGPAAGSGESDASPAPLIVYLADEISTSPHPVVSIDGAKDEAWAAGAVVAVFVARSNAEIENAVLQTMLAAPTLAGVVYSAVFTRAVQVPALLRGVPTVLLNCYEAGPASRGAAGDAAAAGADAGALPLSSVVPAELAGGHAATERLIDAGHRRIALINGEPWMDAAQDRLKGYRRALASHDIAFDGALVREGDWHVGSGHDATLSLMKERPAPTAVFCANDLMAVGCLDALQSLGLQVPRDVSVIGYDDQEIARHTTPPLTTLELPNYEMGRLAVELLLAERRSPGAAPAARRRLKVECRIVERSTVAAPPQRTRRR